MSLLAMNSLYNEKGQWPVPMVHRKKTIIIFRKENLNHLIVFFTKSALFFQYVWFLLPICLPCVVCGTYLTGSNAVPRDTSRGRHSGRVAWLVYLACLRSHVLCAYCNFESKQAISITLFGRHPNRVIE